MAEAKERCADIVGRLCITTRELVGVSGTAHAAGTRWRVYGTPRGRFQIEGVDDRGVTEHTPSNVIVRVIRGVSRKDIDLLPEETP